MAGRALRASLVGTALASTIAIEATGFTLATAPLARAQDAVVVDEGDRAFDIPAESLDVALAAYAKASGVDILYILGPTAGRTSTAIVGRYADAAALQTLLQGTGLTSRFTSRKAAIIYVPGHAPGPTMKGPLPSMQLDMAEVRAPVVLGQADPSLFKTYAQKAVSEIRARLRDDPVCHGSSFRIVASVSVTPSGQVGAVSLLEGSGEAARDARIHHALSGMTLPKPPPGLTRPLRLEIDWSPLDSNGS